MTFIGNKQRPCKANKTGDTKPQLGRDDRKTINSIVNSEDVDHQPAFARVKYKSFTIISEFIPYLHG